MADFLGIDIAIVAVLFVLLAIALILAPLGIWYGVVRTANAQRRAATALEAMARMQAGQLDESPQVAAASAGQDLEITRQAPLQRERAGPSAKKPLSGIQVAAVIGICLGGVVLLLSVFSGGIPSFFGLGGGFVLVVSILVLATNSKS